VDSVSQHPKKLQKEKKMEELRTPHGAEEVFWVITGLPCNVLGEVRRFEATYHLHLKLEDGSSYLRNVSSHLQTA
jgi:hypothetical protein